jgi:hypothetical protein
MSSQERVVNEPKDIYKFLTEKGKEKNKNHFDFSGVNFKCDINFLNILSNNRFGEVSFKDAIFEKNVSFRDTLFLKAANFNSVQFKGSVNFIYANFEATSDFNKAHFSGNAIFNSASFSFDAEFWYTVFLGDAEFRAVNISGNAEFLHSEFIGNADFNSARFFQNANFILAQFKDKSDFSEATVYNDIDFDQAEFSRIANFSKTIFHHNASFQSILFYENAVFYETVFSGIANFYSSRFYKMAIFHNVLFDKNSITDFQLVHFLDVVSFFNTKFIGKNNDFTGTIFTKDIVLNGVVMLNSNRETFRILKHEMIKNNNRIDALVFHQKEMNTYWNDLFGTEQWKKIKSNSLFEKTIKWINQNLIQDFADKFVLILNRYSNNYGLSWTRGILFTLGYISIPFFIIYLSTLSNSYFQWGWHGWKEYWSIVDISIKYWVQFLNPTHPWQFMDEFAPNPIGLAYLVDATSRIFITFGYYQIMQAFRKYRF